MSPKLLPTVATLAVVAFLVASANASPKPNPAPPPAPPTPPTPERALLVGQAITFIAAYHALPDSEAVAKLDDKEADKLADQLHQAGEPFYEAQIREISKNIKLARKKTTEASRM